MSAWLPIVDVKCFRERFDTILTATSRANGGAARS